MTITREPIYLDQFFSYVPSSGSGALSFFVGIVRNHDRHKTVKSLFYDCYPSMADKMIAHLVQEAKQRWKIEEARVLHRVGGLSIGDIAVVVAVESAHRDEAFAANRFLIEGIKHQVPIWKKQFYEDDSSEWTFCAHPAQAVSA